MQGLQKISGCDDAQRLVDVIFVHGLDGDAQSTWQYQNEKKNFWPGWLGADLPDIGVWSLGYEVSSSAWKGHTMPLADRATNTLDLLDIEGLGDRPIMFVCHSLGGLLVKQLLRSASDVGKAEWRRIAEQTKEIVFLSTPHSGADIATWMNHIKDLLRTTISVEELKANASHLRNLNIWFRNNRYATEIKSVVYCEKRKLHGILVVDETSADPGIRDVIPIPVDEDHVSIAKPMSRESQIYKRVRREVKELTENPRSARSQ
jgi:hypothetical protein